MRRKNSAKKEKKSETSKKEEKSKLEEEVEKKDLPPKAEKQIKKRQEQFVEEIDFNLNSKAPVLERIMAGQEMPRFVRTGRARSNEKGREEDSFKYSLDAAKSNEPKYSSFEGKYFSNLIATEQKSRQMADLSKREISFGAMADARISDERKFEKYETPKNLELGRNEFRTDSIQGKKEVKYTPSH